MKSQRVIVIDPLGNIAQKLQTLETDDLKFHCEKSVTGAKLALLNHSCTVGVVVFESSSLITPEEVEPLTTLVPMSEWIAIVAPEFLEATSFQAFVVGSFLDYHTLPLDFQRLLMTIGHACGKARMKFSLNKNRDEKSGRFGIYGNSPVMQKFFQKLEKVFNVDLAVLIGGETGTGKELVAHAIHNNSRRSSGPFVVVNCAAIPEHLIQSELFGHEKGAFTGAVQRKIGSIEIANEGDLFLDEIGDLPLSQQANLLRVLQDRTITRLGSTKPIPVDFRIIAATHIDLTEAVSTGRFREDLFYRLNVLHLNLPPLRHREGDVQLLAEVIFRRYSEGNRNCRAKGFSTQALRAMNDYHWPGNVRELMNRVHRAVILSDNKLVTAADFGLEGLVEESPAATLEAARASCNRTVVESCLKANSNNVSRAARQLGISRVTLYRMMSKYNVEAVR